MNTHTRKSGFSLLELLAVMSIIAVLSTLAVTSYFNAIRGMASRSAARSFRNSLISARQRACIDGARVSLMAFNEISEFDTAAQKDVLIPSFVLCKEIGRVSFVSDPYLLDEFSDLKQLFAVKDDAAADTYLGGFRLYNLTEGKWSFVKSQVVKKQAGGALTMVAAKVGEAAKIIDAHAFEVQQKQDMASGTLAASDWHIGDAYGIEVAPMQSLPRGLVFSECLKADDVWYVTFSPDGTAKTSAQSITIKELTRDGKVIEGGTSTTFGIDDKGYISESN